MAWVKVDDTFPDHPKAVGLPLDAAGLWLCGLCYANRQRTDGHVPRGVAARFGAGAADAAVRALVDAGLWIEDAAGWRIHDYLDYQRSREEIERAAAAARSNGRLGGRPRGAGNPGKTQPKPKAEPGSPSASGSGAAAGAGGEGAGAGEAFAAFYAAYPRRQGKAAAAAAFAQAAERTPPEEILAGLRRQLPWLREQHAQGFCPFPATWLAQERWADEPQPAAAEGRVEALNDRGKWSGLAEGEW